MYKMMALVQLCMMVLVHIGIDIMLIGTLVQDFGWHDYLIGIIALIAVSAIGVKLSWNEWRYECNK